MELVARLRETTPRRLLRKILDALGDLRCSASPLYVWRLFRVSFHSNHDIVNDLFDHANVTPSDVLVEVGCGMGRVVGIMRRRYRRNRIIGIERERTAEVAAKQFCADRNIEIRIGPLENCFPAEGTVFYVFAPSSGTLLKLVKESIDQHNLYNATVLSYGSLKYLHLFENDRNWRCQTLEAPAKGWRRLKSSWWIYSLGTDGTPYAVVLRRIPTAEQANTPSRARKSSSERDEPDPICSSFRRLRLLAFR